MTAADGPHYDEDQRRNLSCVLDQIIPASEDGRLPGAGEVGLAEAVERAAPDMAPMVITGLDALDDLARERGAEGFAGVAVADRAALLESLAETQPAFLPGLVFQTFVAYYQHPRVVAALGMEARPPHPLGYDLEPGDLGPLERVRSRGKLFRDA